MSAVWYDEVANDPKGRSTLCGWCRSLQVKCFRFSERRPERYPKVSKGSNKKRGKSGTWSRDVGGSHCQLWVSRTGGGAGGVTKSGTKFHFFFFFYYSPNTTILLGDGWKAFNCLKLCLILYGLEYLFPISKLWHKFTLRFKKSLFLTRQMLY